MHRSSSTPRGAPLRPRLVRHLATPALRRARALLAGALALLAAPAAVHAQTGTVAGVVVSEAAQTPITGAQVIVVGTQLGTVTDGAGRFRLGGLTGEQVSLEVRRIGFRPTTAQARVGDTELRIVMPIRAIELDETVITGTPGATEKRALGNAVSTINAASITEIAQVNSVHDLLNGRAPGVVVMPATGAVGSGSRVRVRGVASLSLSNEPLLYVDGVRMNNSVATGPESQSFSSSPISRFNDINPEDIETIEILKGPAAATLYGTEASNGVIQIITKRGTSGAPRWTASIKQGINYLRDPEGRFETNYQPVPGGSIRSLDFSGLQQAAGYDIFRNGHLQEYDLGVSGGAGVFRYFLSGGWEQSEGAELSNYLRRYNGRANLSLTPSDNISIDASLGYVRGRTRLSPEAGYGGTVWSVVLMSPANLNDNSPQALEADRRGFYTGRTDEYNRIYLLWQDVSRFTGSLSVGHTPISWFHHRVNFGTDRTDEGNNTWYPRIDELVTNPNFGSEALGLREIRDREVTYNTVDYAATATFNITPALTSATSFGSQYYRTNNGFLYAYGEVFAVPGVSSVRATSLNQSYDEDLTEEASLGTYVQQQFGLNDRLFLTAGVRADDHSAFGSNFDRVYYPKFSLSWVASEEAFWPIPQVNTLKLRAAYGESGKAPETFSSVRTFSPAIGPGGTAAVTPRDIGNPNLGPERGKELELGFDAGFFDDRLGLEFTWYRKRTIDAILDRDVPGSIGFIGDPANQLFARQFFNAGEIRNSGIELLARGRAFESDNAGLELTFTLATNDNEIVSLGEPDLTRVTAGTYREHRVGHPVGAWWERRIVSADLDATGNAINVLCDDGSGGGMNCNTAPFVYLGRTVPKVEGGLGATLTLFRNLRLYGLVDWKSGHKKLDGNTRVRCTFFGGRCRENYFPLEFDAKRIGGVQSGPNVTLPTIVDFLIDDASFAKLRELSAAYTLPERWARAMGASRAQIGIAGRNLVTWTDYGGLEPEAMFMGGTRGGSNGAWEQTTLPQLSQWVFSVNLGY